MSERMELYLDECEAEYVISSLEAYRDHVLETIGDMSGKGSHWTKGNANFNDELDTWLAHLGDVRQLIEKTKYAIDAAFSPGEVAQ